MQVILQNSDYCGGGGKSSDNILFLDLDGGIRRILLIISVVYFSVYFYTFLYTFILFCIFILQENATKNPNGQ